jgi:hypothetical protein
MKIKFLIFVILFSSILTQNCLSCTTFLLSGKYTQDGKSLLFKNRDAAEEQNALVNFNDGKYPYIGLVDCNKEWKTMVWGGYNSKGFAIMNSAAYNNNVGDSSKFNDQEGVIMKKALMSCVTLQDFENLLNSLPKPWGLDANFGVIDAYGGAAFYETGNHDFQKFDANDPTIAPYGLLIRTNHSTRADKTKGFGYCRYNTATSAISQAAIDKTISPQFIFNNLSRNLYHSITKTDLSKNIPLKKETADMRFFIDYIPRHNTTSAIVIVGAKDEKHTQHTMMWTILGFPLTSIAIPTWISGGEKLPELVSRNDKHHAPICVAALKMKAECFPLTYDKGFQYIDLSKVLNQENTGYMQLLQKVETEVFIQSNVFNYQLESGIKTEKDIPQFYKHLDDFITISYKQILGIDIEK